MCSFKFLKRQPNNRQGLKYLRRLAIEILRSLRCLWHDSIGSFNTSYSNSKEEMEVANTVKSHEVELRASIEDFDEDWLRRFLERGVQVKNRKKNSRYWMLSLFSLCSVFNGEIYATEWAVFVSVDITSYSLALSYLLDFSILRHSCRRSSWPHWHPHIGLKITSSDGELWA